MIGSWELVSYTSTNQSDPSDILYPMTKHCKGIIIYSGDGYMSAQLQVLDIQHYAKGWRQGSQEELAQAAKKTMAYTGPFYLEEVPGTKQTLYHHMDISVPPNWIDGTQIRLAEMVEEDGLQYLYLGPSTPTENNGVSRDIRLKWRRLKDNTGAKPPENAPRL